MREYPLLKILDFKRVGFIDFDDYFLLEISPVDGSYVKAALEDFGYEPVDERSEKEAQAHVNFVLSENLKFELNNLLLCANIAHPGNISTLEGNVFIDGEIYENVDGFYAFDMKCAIEEANKLKWPSFTSISVSEVIEWQKRTNAFDGGISTKQVGRAIAALSNTIEDPQNVGYSALRIAWCILGLEALYCKEKSGLREQLSTNTELLLGAKEENKKVFGKLYDFRSQLLHGSINVPLRYTISDDAPKFNKFVSNITPYENLALAILLATLQKMIKNNWVELNFPRSLKGINIP